MSGFGCSKLSANSSLGGESVNTPAITARYLPTNRRAVQGRLVWHLTTWPSIGQVLSHGSDARNHGATPQATQLAHPCALCHTVYSLYPLFSTVQLCRI